MNTVTFSGNLTRDPEMRETGSGKKVCNFTVANNDYKDRPVFIRVTAWDKTAEIACERFTKGAWCIVEGRLTQDEYEKDGQKKSSTGITAMRIEPLFKLDKKKDEAEECPF